MHREPAPAGEFAWWVGGMRGTVPGRNAAALVLAVAAALVLTAAMVAPVIRYSEFGAQAEYSLIGGITRLLREGDWFIGGVLLLFSVFFPYAKLAVIAYAAWAGGWRGWLQAHVRQLGPLSLLDVFVIAVGITLVKMRDVLEASARYGIVLFCVAILLSLVAAHFVADIKEDDMEPEYPAGDDAAGSAGGAPAAFLPARWAVVVAVLLVAGGCALAVVASRADVSAMVEAVRVESRPGLKMPELSVSGLIGTTGDLVLVVATPTGDVRSETVRHKVVGGGLDFVLGRPVRRDTIVEIGLFDPRDKGVVARAVGFFRGAKPLDRVDHVGEVTDGAQYRFTLVFQPDAQRRRTLLLGGAAACAIAAFLLLGVSALVRRRAA